MLVEEYEQDEFHMELYFNTSTCLHTSVLS